MWILKDLILRHQKMDKDIGIQDVNFLQEHLRVMSWID